jgi:hypothetical protein
MGIASLKKCSFSTEKRMVGLTKEQFKVSLFSKDSNLILLRCRYDLLDDLPWALKVSARRKN